MESEAAEASDAVEFEVLGIPGCPNTGSALELYSRALALEGIDGAVRHRDVGTDAEAAALGFLGSPTFRVNGSDLFPSTGAPAVSCRIYPGSRGSSGVPSLEQLREAIRASMP